jgi:hypothetical protein
LIGGSLMQSDNPGVALRKLLQQHMPGEPAGALQPDECDAN